MGEDGEGRRKVSEENAQRLVSIELTTFVPPRETLYSHTSGAAYA